MAGKIDHLTFETHERPLRLPAAGARAGAPVHYDDRLPRPGRAAGLRAQAVRGGKPLILPAGLGRSGGPCSSAAIAASKGGRSQVRMFQSVTWSMREYGEQAGPATLRDRASPRWMAGQVRRQALIASPMTSSDHAGSQALVVEIFAGARIRRAGLARSIRRWRRRHVAHPISAERAIRSRSEDPDRLALEVLAQGGAQRGARADVDATLQELLEVAADRPWVTSENRLSGSTSITSRRRCRPGIAAGHRAEHVEMLDAALPQLGACSRNLATPRRAWAAPPPRAPEAPRAPRASAAAG